MRNHLQKFAKTAMERLNHASSISSRPLRSSVSLLYLLLLLSVLPAAADSSVRIEVPDSTAWTGQRIPIFIELRADGSFTGAAAFDIPEIPGTVVLRIGSPVLGSLTEGGTEFFTQRHEFALFSQTEGALQLPPITARFSHRKGYTGPSSDVSLETKPATLAIRRPPGSANLGFIVTTGSLQIVESWDPQPGPVETGAVFKRTITQKAAQMTGIALAPAPNTAPEGIRVYLAEPEVMDRTERGEFSGERRETITYLVRQPGAHTLPAIRYDWWNPDTGKLETKTLPAVSFTATAPPRPATESPPARFIWLLLPLALLAGAWWLRSSLAACLRDLHDRINPPAARADRKFLRACRRDDPAAAIRFWAAVRRCRPDLAITADLDARLLDLHRSLYGPQAAAAWSGRPLADAFRLANRKTTVTREQTPLPSLNP